MSNFQTHDCLNHVKFLSITIQPVVCGIINVVFGLLCLLLKDVEILETFNHCCLIIQYDSYSRIRITRDGFFLIELN